MKYFSSSISMISDMESQVVIIINDKWTFPLDSKDVEVIVFDWP